MKCSQINCYKYLIRCRYIWLSKFILPLYVFCCFVVNIHFHLNIERAFILFCCCCVLTFAVCGPYLATMTIFRFPHIVWNRESEVNEKKNDMKGHRPKYQKAHFIIHICTLPSPSIDQSVALTRVPKLWVKSVFFSGSMCFCCERHIRVCPWL